MPNAIHANLAIIHKLDIKNLDACADIFADNFVWHYFNSDWPEIEGDYQGVSGLKDFFARVMKNSNGREYRTSTKRIMKPSVRPPMKPAKAP